MSKDEHVGRKLAAGALIGGLVGYITGIFTAPKSGEATRRGIANKAEDIKESAAEQLQDAHDELQDLLASAKRKSLSLGSKAREEFNEAVATGKDAQNKASTTLKAFKAGEADDPELNRSVRQTRAAIKNLKKYLKG